MGRTKVLEFNVGDLVLCKNTEEVLFITDKTPRIIPDDMYKYSYVAYCLTDNEYYSIFVSINNKHYKVLA